MKKELKSKIIQKCKSFGKRGLSFILIFAMLIGYVCLDKTENASANEEVLEMPSFPLFNILPAQIAENTQYYKAYNHANDCHYESIGSGGGYSRGKGYDISNLRFTGTYSVINQWVSDNGGFSISVMLGPKSGWNIFKGYSQEEQISMRLLYTKAIRVPGKYTYTTYQTEGVFKTEWTPMEKKQVGFSSEGIFDIYDVLLVLADLNLPDNDQMSAAVLDETPVIWMNCGEQIRPANYSITKSDLKNLKMKVTFVPKLDQSEENAISVTFKATEVEMSEGKIGFVPEDAQSVETLMGNEWRIIAVEDASEVGAYPLVTTLGETELTVPSPITDMAGNPVVLAEKLDCTGKTKLYLDAVSPVATSSVLSGSMIKADTSEEILQADMFAGPGEEVGLSLKLSEKVSLVSGANKDNIYLKWNVKDAQGNYVTTKLQSIQTTDEVNVGRVSVLVFEPVVVEEGMQGVLTPLELVGSEYIVDASNNKMDSSVEQAYPDRQIGIDSVGPILTIGESVVTKINTNTEKYYIFPINISDGDDKKALGGAGLLTADKQSVTQYFTVSSDIDVTDLKWKFAITSDTSDVTFGSEANMVTSMEQYEQFAVESSGDYYLHLYLSAAERAEIADSITLDLDFLVSDAKGNTAKCTARTLTGMGLDGKTPLLVVTPQAVENTRDEEDANVNNIKFAANVVASDLNGISELVYQWVNVGEEPTENNWVSITSGTTAEFTTAVDFSSGNPVVTNINKVLCVRVTDNAGNSIEYRSEDSVFAANVERVNARYEIVYDDNKAGGISNIKIYKSVVSDGSEGGYTRVMVTLGEDTYVRVFDSAAFTEDYDMLFDAEATEWYEVTVDTTTGKYTSVSSEKVAIDWETYYGVLTIDIAASAEDLTPVAEAQLVPSEDTSFQAGRQLEMIYTCARNDVHNISFNGVKDSDGVVIDTTYTTETGIEYYKFNFTLAGLKYNVAIDNALLQSLGVADVNFASSYAVFVKADAEGNVTTEAVTDRISLMNGTQQSIVAPYKEGGYETGVYALKVYIVQRDGGTQEFTISSLFMVDNEVLPEQYGITEYDREVHAAYGYYGHEVIELNEVAPEGEYITSVNVGVAPETYTEEIVYVDGKPAFTRTSSNAIGGDRGVTITLRAETKGTTLLGEALGQVSSVRVWNQASKQGAEEVEWNTDGVLSSVRVQNDYTEATLDLVLLEGYMDEYSIVDAETLAELDWNDFRVKMGRNVICYQFLLENGRMSPVYTFEINLYDEAPDVEVSYVMEQAFEGVEYIQDDYYFRNIIGTEYLRTYAQSYAFKVDSAYSEGGAISVYHAIHNSDSGWEYFKVDADNPILIEEENIYGYTGLDGTNSRYYSGEYHVDNGVSEFFMVIDEVGNAYSYYPIINSEPSVAEAIRDEYGNVIWDENEWAIGIAEDSEPIMTYFTANKNIGKLDVVVYEPSEEYDGGVSHMFDFGEYYPGEVFEKLSITVDDRAEVVLEREWEAGINQAGIVYYDGYSLDMVFPYDYTKAEGEMITHTVVVKGYVDDAIATDMDGNEAVQTLTITAPNTKPALTQNGTPEVGAAQVQANTYLFAEGITDGFECDFALSVYANGTYAQGFYDIVGGYHELEVEITDMPTDPTVEISTTDITVDPVEITIKSDGGGVFTISEYTELPSVATVTGLGTSELQIVMEDNGYFEVVCTYADGSTKNVVIDVTNIHNDPIVPEVKWSYSEYMVNPEDNSYEGEVTATLVDKNGSPLTDLATGLAPSYTFVPGGETSYTFTNYVNVAGVVGADFEVVLPITLKTPEEVVEDTYKPDVAVTGYAKFQNATIILDGAYMSVDSSRGEDTADAVAMLPDYEAIYGEEYIYDSMDDLLSQPTLVEKFILTLDVGDESDVKIFIVEDKQADAPEYSTGVSDTIEGVSLIGRTLQITENAEFTLHFVDSKNNVTSLNFNVTNLTDKAPEPTVTQILTKDKDEVRVYLTKPNLTGVSDFTITNDGVQIESDTTSSFYGIPYLSFSKNYPDGVSVFYSYMYAGQKVEGSVVVYITEFDDSLPEVIKTNWSANYDSNKYTNQNITVQFELSKLIDEVYPVDSEGNRILAPEGVTITYLEDRITVIYEKNAEAISLKVTDSVRNTITNTIDLPAITTIDKVAAQLSVEKEYLSNHRKMKITVIADEMVTWPDGTVGTEYEFTIAQNGDYEIRVSDKATNNSTVSISAEDIITTDLTIVLSTDGSDATMINPTTYQVDIGDRLYVKTNRTSVVTLNGNATGISAREGVWTEITIEEDSEGLYPTISAVDEYGNLAMVQLLQIPIKDRVAPSILLNKNQVAASLDATEEEIAELLRGNYVASDNVTAAEDLEFRYEIPNVQSAGTYSVTYYVEDEAGNVASVTGWIRLYNGEEISVEVNGERVERNETIIVSAGAQIITVTHNGEPYKVEWRKGLKSLGQMKNNANILTEYTDEVEKEMTLELTEAGYYTILLTTQGRDMYRLVIYVEE